MKQFSRIQSVIGWLEAGVAVGLLWMCAGEIRAQTFRTLYNFTAEDPNTSTNIDGAYPDGGLVLGGNTLYGFASEGGIYGYGTLYALNTSGTGFTNLHDFSYLFPNNGDGGSPYGTPLLLGNMVYGTTSRGGAGGGTIFAVKTDGSGFTNIHNFCCGQGAESQAGVILAGTNLYGTTVIGGLGYGTVFAVNTNGSAFTNLHSFTPDPNFTNNDGANPYAGLVLSGNRLYGVAAYGGNAGSGEPGSGTVFAINADGTSFNTLHKFAPRSLPYLTNSDGAYPVACLIAAGDRLYGAAQQGGMSNAGTLFTFNADGTGFSILHQFTGSNGEGVGPAGLLLSGSRLYGTTANGGAFGSGTIFSVNTNGTGFVTIYSFTATSGSYFTNRDGANPTSAVILSDNRLYGTASSGGSAGYGTVFSLSLEPQLAITVAGTNVLITWSTNFAGFTLQSSTNLVSPVSWDTVSPAPAPVNGLNTVTNSISGSQRFYRLSQ